VSPGDSSQIPELLPNTKLDNVNASGPVTPAGQPDGFTWRRLLDYSGPMLVVAVVLVLMATVYYFRWGFNHRSWGTDGHPSAVPVWLAFNDLGQVWSAPIGEQGQSVPLTGYDGQFYFYMAENPAVISACERGALHCPIDANPEREQRILYPMTARLLTLGNADLLHPTLFFIDFGAILITVFLVGRLCLEAGASKWLSVAAGIFSGEVMGLLRDLAEPYAVMWTVLAVYLLRRNRPLWSALAVAAAMLTREQLVLVLPLLVVPLLAERRFRTACFFALISLGPFIVWQLTLHQLFGRWGLAGSFADSQGVRLPFQALWAHHASSGFAVTVLFAALPLVASLLISLNWIWRRGPRALLTDPVPLLVLIYGVLATLTSYSQWGDTWASTRIVAPIAVLSLVVAAGNGGLGPRWRTVYAMLIGATMLVMFVASTALY
jgi:hypothetical protein